MEWTTGMNYWNLKFSRKNPSLAYSELNLFSFYPAFHYLAVACIGLVIATPLGPQWEGGGGGGRDRVVDF